MEKDEKNIPDLKANFPKIIHKTSASSNINYHPEDLMDYNFLRGGRSLRMNEQQRYRIVFF
jgi:hypothetical protein